MAENDRVEKDHEREQQIDWRPAVVVLCTDMMQSIRIQDAIERAGGRAVLVEDLTDPVDALDAVDGNLPVLTLIDLAVEGDWATVIQRCKLRPHTRQIPIYAFGSHVDAETLRSAREAGADHAWARSRMMEELADVVSRYVNPPVRYLEGWDDELSDAAKAGIAEFNRREYFEQHELLEKAWMAEKRPIREMHQGILQVGVAFYQIEQGNWAGSMKLFGRGLPKLRGLPEVCQGVQVGEFRRQAESVRAEIAQLGPDRLAEFDRQSFPQIEMEAGWLPV